MNLRTGIYAGATTDINPVTIPPQGLGDAIAGFTTSTGIDQLSKVYEDMTGKSCGCDERQRKLNMLFPISPIA
jgi:hypothetical protein